MVRTCSEKAGFKPPLREVPEVRVVIDVTDAEAVKRVIDAQDDALRRQKEKAEASRRKTQPWPEPKLYD